MDAPQFVAVVRVSRRPLCMRMQLDGIACACKINSRVSRKIVYGVQIFLPALSTIPREGDRAVPRTTNSPWTSRRSARAARARNLALMIASASRGQCGRRLRESSEIVGGVAGFRHVVDADDGQIVPQRSDRIRVAPRRARQRPYSPRRRKSRPGVEGGRAATVSPRRRPRNV